MFMSRKADVVQLKWNDIGILEQLTQHIERNLIQQWREKADVVNNAYNRFKKNLVR